jgi:hypothetical protein
MDFSDFLCEDLDFEGEVTLLDALVFELVFEP